MTTIRLSETRLALFECENGAKILVKNLYIRTFLLSDPNEGLIVKPASNSCGGDPEASIDRRISIYTSQMYPLDIGTFLKA